MENEKKYTLKTAQSELERLQKRLTVNQEKRESLNKEIVEQVKQIRRLKQVIDELERLSIHTKIDRTWLSKEGITLEQAKMLIRVGSALRGKMDSISADEIVMVIEDYASTGQKEPENYEKLEETKPEKPAAQLETGDSVIPPLPKTDESSEPF